MTSKPLSGRLLGLKFMQKAKEKEVKELAEETAQEHDAEAHWVVEGARTRCVVIAEGDPPPSGSAAGRLSFGGFGELANKKLKDEERQAAAAAAAAAEANNAGGTSISDEAMAASLNKVQRQQQQQQQQQRQQQHSGKKHGRAQQGDGRRDRKNGRQRDDDQGGKPNKQRARYF